MLKSKKIHKVLLSLPISLSFKEPSYRKEVDPEESAPYTVYVWETIQPGSAKNAITSPGWKSKTTCSIKKTQCSHTHQTIFEHCISSFPYLVSDHGIQQVASLCVFQTFRSTRGPGCEHDKEGIIPIHWLRITGLANFIHFLAFHKQVQHN